MKKIFTLLASAFIATMSFAQDDIAIDAINYNLDGTDFMSDNVGPISIAYTNLGADINSGDTIFFAIQLNGITVTFPGFLSAGLATNESDTFRYHTIQSQANFAARYQNQSLFGSSATSIGGVLVGPNRSIRVFPALYRVGGAGLYTDIDNTNDTVSLAYTLVDGDFSSTDIQVVDSSVPVNAQDELPLGQTIDTISFTLTNESALNHHEYSFPIERSVAGNLDTLFLNLPLVLDDFDAVTGIFPGTGQAPNNSFTISLPIDAADLPSTTLGDFDICVRGLYVSDANTSNDQVCRTFKYVVGVGVEEVEAGEINAFFNNNELNVNNSKLDNATIQVLNIAGQVVYNGTINRGANVISLNEKAGVYIVNIDNTSMKVVKH